jgi:hypothetical protein
VSDRVRHDARMNLNREQFLAAVDRGRSLLQELKSDYPELKLVPAFSRFGPRSGQCDMTTDLKKIVMEFSLMLTEENFSHEKHENSQKVSIQQLRDLLFAIRAAEKDGEKEKVSNLWKEAAEIEKALLDPKLKLYCGDVLIEYRPGILKYEPLRRLQNDSRLPQGVNEVGNIRVIVGSLELLSGI